MPRARRELPQHAAIRRALADLDRLAATQDIPVSVDLADLRGYHYHSGVTFAAYCAGLPGAIALGGRYDGVGRAFGRARPATGFTLYLRELARIAPAEPIANCIRAPALSEPSLDAAMARLRARGEVVIQELPGCGNDGSDGRCKRQLVRQKGRWQVRKT